MTKPVSSIRKLTLCGIFTALIIAGAFLNFPGALPITLQTLFTALAGLLLGRRWGAISVLVYLLLGLAGLPIFARGGGGITYLLSPTFGFLLGFVGGTWLTGLIFEKSKKRNFISAALACLAGYAVIYAIGLPFYYFITNYYLGTDRDISWVLYYCFLITLPGDLIKCLAVSVLAPRLAPLMKRFA